MEYHEAASFLFDLRRFRMKPGTESTARLLADLGAPHEGPTYVQIAGSNGKGSTARMVESVLREAGLDVGLYTSPHLDDLREQVLVDGRPMAKRAVCEFVEAVRPLVTERAADGEGPTFFEVLTAMALWEFGRQDVDVAVLEVGIGGRYDATSVVDPTASAVTAVSLEHTELLGDTVEEIARDKAQVAPADGPLVTATTGDALAAIRDEVGEVLVVGTADDGSDRDVTVAYGGINGNGEGQVTVEGPGWSVETPLDLVGAHQARNAGVAAAIVHQLIDVDEATLARGLRGAHWPGRFEITGREPLVVLDGAHNPGASAVLAETLAEFEFEGLTLVFGAMHDKDHADMVAALPPADRVIACDPATDRAADPAVLARVFREAGYGDVTVEPAVEDAVEAALDDADPNDAVVITGSLYAVAEARRRWSRTEVPKRVESVDDARDVLEAADVGGPDVWRLRGEGRHHVLKTRLLPRQATGLREAMLRAGGECAVSAVSTQSAEYVDVVLMGTHGQFEAVLEDLPTRPGGLAAVARSLRDALGIDAGRPRRGYPWEDRTAVMGIVNVTPDSFHDGGRFDGTDLAVTGAERMVEAGADIVDVGGESTRPGAEPVSPETERERVVPVIERLADLDALVSVDTRRASVAAAALEAGADIINDVSGLGDPEMRFVAAEHDAPLVVMHSIDTPVDPDHTPEYDDVVEDVIDALAERVLLAERAGLDREQIIVDPGLGFGKTAAESFALLDRADELRALGCPVMIGHSHKSMFEAIGYGADEREHATVAASALAAARGADVLRVHDVPENVAAVRAVEAAAHPERWFE
ncbi:MAG: dihydropteroate synthase [Halobacteriales archaeon]|nr:dihydropteroate synthase [Halobacteriales archaeon]